MATRPPASQELRVVIAAGGTGGHIYPAIAIAQALVARHPGAKVLFIGTRERMESRVVPAAGFDLATIAVRGLRGRQRILRRARSFWGLLSGRSVRHSLRILRMHRPHVVVGMGGYVSGPVILAARLLRIPRITVEQNQRPGFTARLTAHMSQALCVPSPQAAENARRMMRDRARIEVTGNPVRREIIETASARARAALGLAPDRLTIVATGGSLGSPDLNAAFSGAVEILARDENIARRIQALHLTGERDPTHADADLLRRAGVPYHARTYLDEMHLALAAADIIVTRGGGTALAEIAARGVAAIIIPWSGAAGNEQEQNARPLAEAGAAIVIRDAELNAGLLAKMLRELVEDDERREAMARRSKAWGRPDAAERVAAIIEELAGISGGAVTTDADARD
jgi:UDP-N-acetylglucosamine--N-acetylmuramyl-(pentapeptide) pyrophosphoryl-undecaprenol N-acetylglucosamine transferase